MDAILVALGALVALIVAGTYTIRNLIYICAPNEVLIFSGRRRRVGERSVGYRLFKGGRGVRIPLFERVDRMDLTNMIIELSASGAYCRGGVPITVQAVANVKVAGHEPVLNNAIERFLGRGRPEIIRVAKATLEGALRGVLAKMTPEQVNEDKVVFAEELVKEAKLDMTNLGLTVDTLNVQNVHDDVQYLDSIGRKQSAEVIRRARIAEAVARADAVVREATNKLKEQETKIRAQIAIATADADKQMADVLSRRDALVAEEKAAVAQAVAQAKAEVNVQKARVEQVRRRLDADVVQPAKAACEAAELDARGAVAPIIQDGSARADALRTLAESWRHAGSHARQIFLLQKFDTILPRITSVVSESIVEKLTVIDGRAPSLGSDELPIKALSTAEQVKEVFGVDVIEKLKTLRVD